MGAIDLYLDTVLVPLSMFLTIGYHAFLWRHSFINTKPCTQTSIGIQSLKRRTWFQAMKQGDDRKGMLAVQSLRNTLMATIFTATLAILVTVALAALSNNTYNAVSHGHLFTSIGSSVFGSQSGRILILKYGSASLFLLVSFLCSSMAVGCLIDANFLINVAASSACASADHDDGFSISDHQHQQQQGYINYTQRMLERGFLLALVGNRVLCITFPVLLWIMLGPVPVVVSSLALVWGLFELDFASANFSNK